MSQTGRESATEPMEEMPHCDDHRDYLNPTCLTKSEVGSKEGGMRSPPNRPAEKQS